MSQQIALGGVFLAELDNQVGATVTLQWKDELFWPKAPPDAGYLHKLALKKQYHGIGLGFRIMEWAIIVAAGEGKKYLRLDCMTENRKLRDYYERAGFIHKGDVQGSWWRASLYEKKIRSGLKSIAL